MRTVGATLVVLLAACGGPRVQVSPASEADFLDIDDVDDSTDSAAADSTDGAGRAHGLAPRVACYFGDLKVTKPGEAETNQGALLVKLTVDQSRSQIVEETWSFPLYESYVITRAIRGSTFDQRQDDGAFVGTGKLEGEPWIWSRWTATTASQDQKTRVESDTHVENGALVTQERVLDAAGALQFDVRHNLDEIPLDECSNMFAKARTNAASMRAASAPASPSATN